jgi:methionyl-tRNA formyltransferase
MSENPLPDVVFYGTPEFAVPSLKILIENSFPVKAVVTAPDKPSGRGLSLKPSPVKEYALTQGIEILQPDSLQDTDFLEKLRKVKPDLQVVVAFRKLPQSVWKLPGKGTFNLHASLLPDYRGAAPINWALINGDDHTGVTTFFIDDTIDTGSMLLSEKVDIYPDDTAGSLHDRLMSIGASLVLKTAMSIVNKTVIPFPQPVFGPGDSTPRKAPKIFKEHCEIHWEKRNTEIYNQIRGLSPSPGAYSELIDQDGNIHFVKIFSSEIMDKKESAVPGTIVTDSKSFCIVSTGAGWITLKNIQFSGRKVLYIRDILNGYPITSDWRFKV